MELLKIQDPSIRATEYKQWREGDSLIEVYKWGMGGNFAHRHLIREESGVFTEKEVRAVTKSYYESLSVKPIKIQYF